MPTPPSPRFDPDRLERLRAWADGYVERGDLPHVGVLVASSEATVFVHWRGDHAPEGARPFGPDSLIRIYSMTKPVTGVALLQLLEEGAFQLDDPIGLYLPELADMRVLVGGSFHGVDTRPAQAITIRHLATHTAGLTYDFFPHDPVAALYRDAGITGGLPASRHESLEEWTRALAELPLAFQPGKRWQYSVGMDVLGRLIEVVAEQRFGDFLRERIFEPLGMHDTGFWAEGDRAERLSPLYRRKQDGSLEAIDPGGTQSPLAQSAKVDFGGGGLLSTANDYLRFARALLRGGELDGERILGRKSVELLCSNHLPHRLTPAAGHAPITSLASMRWFRGATFGITVAVTEDPARDGVAGTPGAFGWGGAASTQFWIDPGEGFLAMQLTQFVPSGTYPLRPQLRSLVYQALI